MRQWQDSIIKFQFQSGSIKTRVRAAGLQLGQVRFNSNLVRLKQEQLRQAGKKPGDVSIPIWFD